MQQIGPLPAAERHRVIADNFTEVAAAVSQWDAPAPVDGWVAVDVVAHLVEWFRAFLASGGVQLPDVPDVADDPVAAWRAHAAAVGELLDGAGAQETFSHPMIGELPLADAIDRFYIADVYMHTWDLAQAGGIDAGLDPEFAVQLLAGMVEIDEILRSSGQYGPAVEVAADADPVTRLMGFVGRDPDWAMSPR